MAFESGEARARIVDALRQRAARMVRAGPDDFEQAHPVIGQPGDRRGAIGERAARFRQSGREHARRIAQFAARRLAALRQFGHLRVEAVELACKLFAAGRQHVDMCNVIFLALCDAGIEGGEARIHRGEPFELDLLGPGMVVL